MGIIDPIDPYNTFTSYFELRSFIGRYLTYKFISSKK